MFYLEHSTASQTIYLSLKEGRYLYDDTFTDYLMVLTNESTGQKFYVIPVLTAEVERYTTLTISTASQAPTTGAVLITNTGSGTYYYEVYGQNSSTNLDPEDAVVVGLVEQGRCVIGDTATFITASNSTIPAAIAHGN